MVPIDTSLDDEGTWGSYTCSGSYWSGRQQCHSLTALLIGAVHTLIKFPSSWDCWRNSRISWCSLHIEFTSKWRACPVRGNPGDWTSVSEEVSGRKIPSGSKHGNLLELHQRGFSGSLSIMFSDRHIFPSRVSRMTQCSLEKEAAVDKQTNLWAGRR